MSGRKEKNYPKKEILKAIKGSYGLVSNIAKILNCDWHTAERNINRFDETKRAFLDEKESLIDFAEGKAIQAMSNGDGAMIRYYLSTLGKDRGFTQEQNNDKEETDNELTLTITDEAAE